VEEDQLGHINQGSCGESSDADWGLSRVCRRDIDLDGEYFFPDASGREVISYIIDTGIYIQHADFNGRAKFGFKSDSNWPDTDDHGHGTHVASTVGGIQYGVAKHVHLVGVKVLNAQGSGSYAGIIAGVDYTVAEKLKHKKPTSANMSLGGGVSTALNLACNSATAQGVMIVVAAGNNNQNACLYSPASATEVISVGATELGSDANDNPLDVRSYFSNFGTCTHVFAPGTAILGAWIGNPHASRTISGTSMASPHVCGVASLMLHDTPDISFDDLRDKITSTATVGKIEMKCTNSMCERSPNLMVFNGCE